MSMGLSLGTYVPSQRPPSASASCLSLVTPPLAGAELGQIGKELKVRRREREDHSWALCLGHVMVRGPRASIRLLVFQGMSFHGPSLRTWSSLGSCDLHSDLWAQVLEEVAWMPARLPAHGIAYPSLAWFCPGPGQPQGAHLDPRQAGGCPAR